MGDIHGASSSITLANSGDSLIHTNPDEEWIRKAVELAPHVIGTDCCRRRGGDAFARTRSSGRGSRWLPLRNDPQGEAANSLWSLPRRWRIPVGGNGSHWKWPRMILRESLHAWAWRQSRQEGRSSLLLAKHSTQPMKLPPAARHPAPRCHFGLCRRSRAGALVSDRRVGRRGAEDIHRDVCLLRLRTGTRGAAQWERTRSWWKTFFAISTCKPATRANDVACG